MGPPIIMLMLANTLGNILRYDLHTGDYLAQAFTGSLSVSFLPLMLFVISTVTALLTGTSWATMALLLPIAIPMITSLSGAITPCTISALPVIFPALGALFSGAVCGDHLSPISETTIMASAGAGTKPIKHFYTQLPYALPAILASVVSFTISGLLISQPIGTNLFISLASGLGICISLLILATRTQKQLE